VLKFLEQKDTSANSLFNNLYMLQTVWNELDYRVGVCRITKDAHIEHL